MFGSRPKVTLFRAVILGALCFVVLKYWLRPAWVDGDSMDPTVRDGQFRMLNLQAYRSKCPERFDIVAIRGAGDRFLLLKRIIGLPGETVMWNSGKLLIDGVEIEEPYLVGGSDWEMRVRNLGQDEYFVAGDNRGITISNHILGVTSPHWIYGELLW